MSSWMVWAGRAMTWSLGALAVMVGCSSSDGGGSNVTADEACNQYAAAVCDKAQSCAGTFISVSFGDVATCKARALLECKADLSAPSTAITPADLAACATASTSASCAALLDNEVVPACLPKSGGLADGQACGTDSQCKSAFCALDGDVAVCGKCAPKPVEGGACLEGKCPAGLRCSRKSTCAKVVADGGACDDGKPCATGSACYKGVCTKGQATEGAACDEATVAAPGCDGTKGFLCLAKKCTQAKFAAEGQPCGLELDASMTALKSVTLCQKGGYCKGVDTSARPPVFKGTCAPAAKEGEACVADADISKGPGCLEPAECVGGKCVLPDPAACK
jgi:hypothetical protein